MDSNLQGEGEGSVREPDDSKVQVELEGLSAALEDLRVQLEIVREQLVASVNDLGEKIRAAIATVRPTARMVDPAAPPVCGNRYLDMSCVLTPGHGERLDYWANVQAGGS